MMTSSIAGKSGFVSAGVPQQARQRRCGPRAGMDSRLRQSRPSCRTSPPQKNQAGKSIAKLPAGPSANRVIAQMSQFKQREANAEQDRIEPEIRNSCSIFFTAAPADTTSVRDVQASKSELATCPSADFETPGSRRELGTAGCGGKGR